MKSYSAMQLVQEAEEKFAEVFENSTNKAISSSNNESYSSKPSFQSFSSSKAHNNESMEERSSSENTPFKCISVMLQLYSKLKWYDKSFQLMQQINELGFSWNISYINSLIKMYGETEQFEEIENLINNVDSMGLKPDMQFYSAIIEAYASHGDFEYVESLIENLKSMGMLVNKEILHKLIYFYGRAHNWRQVQYCLDLFQIQKFKTNIDTFEALMRGRLEVKNLFSIFIFYFYFFCFIFILRLVTPIKH